MRADRLHKIDFALNLVQLVGATTVGTALLAKASTEISQVASAVVVLCALFQIVGKVGRAASDHERLMEKWSDLDRDIVTGTESEESVRTWYNRFSELNKSHMGRLPVLEVIASNDAARALGFPDQIRAISYRQSLFRHLISSNSEFRFVHEIEAEEKARTERKSAKKEHKSFSR